MIILLSAFDFQSSQIIKWFSLFTGFNWGIFYDWEQYMIRLLPYLAWVIVEWWTLDVGIYVVGTFYISISYLIC